MTDTLRKVGGGSTQNLLRGLEEGSAGKGFRQICKGIFMGQLQGSLCEEGDQGKLPGEPCLYAEACGYGC